MNLLFLTVGIALGAVFSPFWLKVWEKIKSVFSKAVPPPSL
jgi:hypothetical protein